MRRLTQFLILLVGIAGVDQAAQVFRIDPPPVMTTAGNAPYGGSPALFAVSNATIALCTDAACATPATAYSDISGNTSCPSYAPVTLPGTAVCTSTTGPQGQFGFWLSTTTTLYYYKVTLPNGTSYGPFPLSIGSAGVTQILPGPGVTITPGGGTGVVTVTSTGPVPTASTYNFGPVAFGAQTLTNGNPATITLAPVPLGVNANNPTYYLSITGCSGGNQTVQVTGGSAVSGASTGTLTFTPSASCVAGFAVGSATGGTQELLCAMPSTGGAGLIDNAPALLSNVNACNKTDVAIEKRAGSTVTGAYTILGSNISSIAGNVWVGNNGLAFYPAVTFAVVPTFPSQTQNQVFASPNGSSGTPSFRALVGADIPQINLAGTGNGGIGGTLPGTNLTPINLASTSNGGVSGTLPVPNGGTGVTTAQGNGTKVQLSTGSPTSGNLSKFDANGNTADSGLPSGAQGNGSKIQLAGTNNGVSGSELCNDASGNSTTSCPSPLPSASAQLQYLRIQPNTGNTTTGQFIGLPELNSADYNYSALAPSSPSTLTGGAGAQTITVAICPLGIYSVVTAGWSPVYLTAGSGGTAEAVTPSGGTCSAATLGINGGTVVVSPVSNHGSGYTLASATSGIQEAINSIPATGSGGGSVRVPQGTWNVYATIIVIHNGTWIRGIGRVASTLNWLGATSGDVVFFNGTGSSGGIGNSSGLTDIQISGNSVNSSTNYGVHVDNQVNFTVRSASIAYLANGIRVTSNGNDFQNTYSDLIINLPAVGGGDGVRIENGGGVWHNIQIGGDQTSNTNGFHVFNTGGLWIDQSQTLYAGIGFNLSPGTSQSARWIWVSDSTFDTSYGTANILIQPSSTGTVYGAHFVNSWSSDAQHGHGTYVRGTGGGVDGVMFIGHRSIVNAENGYLVDGTPLNVTFDHCIAAGNNTSNGGYSGLSMAASVTHFYINGGQYAQVYGQNNTQSNGIALSSGNDYFSITDAMVTPNVTNAISASTTAGTVHTIIRNNIGYNPVGIATTTCTTTAACPTTALTVPSTLYITGGTVTGVVKGGLTICAASPCTVTLAPGQTVIPTFTGSPVFTLDIQ